MRKVLASLLLMWCMQHHQVLAQTLTNEDSLYSGLIQKEKATVISGYGEVKVGYDMRLETAKASVTRAVLFVGHKFSPNISLFSEVELENTQISGDDEGGELSLEQLYLKFNLNKDHFITAGLFLPRVGIINENHLPTTFYGNDRPYTEHFVIPATWREIGIGINGIIPAVTGLNYTFSLVNGLNAAGFKNGTGIRDGRYSGKEASMSNLAISGSLLYNTGNFRFQFSGYYGGAAGMSQREADSLQLDNSPFGTPVGLVELSARYSNQVISITALGSYISIPEAIEINRAYANNTPEAIAGGYGEFAVDVLQLMQPEATHSLSCFIRYELMNLNQEIASNGIVNDANEKTYFVAGIQYLPVSGVVIKADYVLRSTGEQNPDLIVNPYPQAPAYYTENGFFNLGLGYSF